MDEKAELARKLKRKIINPFNLFGKK